MYLNITNVENGENDQLIRKERIRGSYMLEQYGPLWLGVLRATSVNPKELICAQEDICGSKRHGNPSSNFNPSKSKEMDR